ncbi:MAG: PhoX family phosphatase [Geodermatophilaceae bacterium]|nr:PhoX family phosphatase [Geodermatophilaceae bacterium]
MTSTPHSVARTETFEAVLTRRVSRRSMLRAGVVVGAGAAVHSAFGTGTAAAAPAADGHPFALDFPPLEPPVPMPFDDTALAAGFTSEVLIRWGDGLFDGMPAFDVDAQTAKLQAQRFGFNSDWTAFFPLVRGGVDTGRDGLLWVNHEYTDGLMMFRSYDPDNPTKQQVDIELAAHGGSLVRVLQGGGGTWRFLRGERNRRVTAYTPIQLTGPAAGDPALRTSADPTGRLVLGTLNNCGGGVTGWGTLLTAEENFDQYFANNDALPEGKYKALNQRFGVPGGESGRKWERFYSRFDLAQEPNEPHRFGWVVEIDPFDPQSRPRKRTALGRLKHEAAAGVSAKDGRWTVYSGDDARFEFVYKFVTRDRVRDGGFAANRDLLDHGTLYVARFNDDGSGDWLPLVFGTGPLTRANGFTSQADILIRARDAGTALGATAMDRPEDIEPNPVIGSVYIALTNNDRRGTEGNPPTDPANPRPVNTAGHVIELVEDGQDAAATSFRWDILLLCGDPEDPSTYYGGFDKSQVSEIAAPDNLAVDSLGQLWIATDGAPRVLPMNDAVVGLPVIGPERGRTRQLFAGVFGSELTGIYFNSTETTMFVAVQHPGEGGTVDEPTSRWPDPAGEVARSSVVAIRPA